MHLSIDQILSKTREPDTKAFMQQMAPHLPPKPTYRNPTHGVLAAIRHINRDLPFLQKGGHKIIEVGPGVGYFMLVAQTLGNKVAGEEAALSNNWVNVYKKVTDFWNLDITHYGFHRYIQTCRLPYMPNTINLFHFRGSLDAILHSVKTSTAALNLLNILKTALAPGGIIWIGHNINSDQESLRRELPKIEDLIELPQKTKHVTTIKKVS